MKKIGILSDTHSYIDDKTLEYLKECDEIWHGGDWGTITVFQKLNNLKKPIRSVFGNIDGIEIKKIFNENCIFLVENVKILITHIAGYPGKYSARVKTLIKEHHPQIVVVGHSHILKILFDKEFNHLHINPGAAGKEGFHQVRTLVTLEINGSEIKNCQVIEMKK